MSEIFFTFLFYGVTCFLLGLAARSDWRVMMIPNRYSLALLGVCVLGMIVPNSLFNGLSLPSSLIAGILTGIITLILYGLRAMGGGDTKLATATALLVGLSHLGIFLVSMTAIGGALAVYALLVKRQPRLLPHNTGTDQTWLSQLKQGFSKVPYGLAIAGGGAIALGLKWVLPLLP